MAVGLCYRILQYGIDKAWWTPGESVILDPMAGIFTTGICAASLGLKCIGVELESHFFKMANDNIDLLMSKLPNAPRPVLIQGDARRLTELLQRADASIMSPPYAEGLGHDSAYPRLDAVEDSRREREGCARRSGYSAPVDAETHVGNPGEQELAAQGRAKEIGTSATGHGGKGRHGFQYSHNPAQVGNCRDPEGDEIFAALGCFDFLIRLCGDCLEDLWKQMLAPQKSAPTAANKKRSPNSTQYLEAREDGQLATREIGGAPASDVIWKKIKSENKRRIEIAGITSQESALTAERRSINSSSDANPVTTRTVMADPIPAPAEKTAGGGKAALKDGGAEDCLPCGIDCVRRQTISVNSADYQNPCSASTTSSLLRRAEGTWKSNVLGSVLRAIRTLRQNCDTGDLQVRNSTCTESSPQIQELRKRFCALWAGENSTYLFSMACIYTSLHAVLKPGGVAVLVVKDPIKSGKRRDLAGDTIKLMECAGFELIEHIHAMLREELGEQGALIGGPKAIVRNRKSFFKRLHERKRPDLAVNFEDVLFFLKPL